jgi:Fe-S-cluster containining protein
LSQRLSLNVVSPPRSEPSPDLPSAVVLSEPMRRFKCNQKGCCCSGWDIPFRLEDFLRLHQHLPEAERKELSHGVKLVVDAEERGEKGETILHNLKLDGVGENRACRFLESSGGCRVHATVGLQALPDLCVDFPAFGFRRDDGEVELWFDPVCPEVLERLDEADTPIALHRQRGGFADPMMDLRVSHSADPIAGRVGAHRLDLPALDGLREACLSALSHPTRPIWQTLAILLDGFSRLKEGEKNGGGFTLDETVDARPALRFLFACIGANGTDLLYSSLFNYRRFVFVLDLPPLLKQRDLLEKHLTDWQPAFEQWLAPQEALLRPLTQRWLAHRFGTPMVKARAELRAAADSILHLYGAALRYASALGAIQQKPVDRATFKVAIGVAEYFYRSLNLPKDSLPWFAASESGAKEW